MCHFRLQSRNVNVWKTNTIMFCWKRLYVTDKYLQRKCRYNGHTVAIYVTYNFSHFSAATFLKLINKQYQYPSIKKQQNTTKTEKKNKKNYQEIKLSLNG